MPRIVNHEDRRREICNALLEIIADSGIAAATIREVADRSGWSTGVINHFFRNRQDLLFGGLRRAAEILGESNIRALELGGLRAVEQLLENTFPIDATRLALCRIFFFFDVEAICHDGLREEMGSYVGKWQKAVARALRQAQENGDLPLTVDARQAAMDLCGLADGLSLHALLSPEVMVRLREQSPVRFWIRRLITSPLDAEPA